MNSQKGIGGIEMKLDKKALQFNLQFFAEPGEGDPATQQPSTAETTPSNEQQEKTYTEQEFQSEIDRRVTQALKKSQEKWQKEYQQKLEHEKQEAERLAKLSTEEREKAIFQKEREEFEKQKREFERERLTNQTLKTLAAEDLPAECCDWIMAGVEKAEDIMTRITDFKKMFSEAVEKRLEERTQTTTPGSGNNQAKSNYTLEDVKKMSPEEINKNWDQIKHLI